MLDDILRFERSIVEQEAKIYELDKCLGPMRSECCSSNSCHCS
uniref:Uncharacterized protein n=1 Tax=Anguilla anguilla TaxID=7936 RepID=A0A0E9PYQ0_ANGAN